MRPSWRPSNLVDAFWRSIGRAPRVETPPVVKERGRFDHVVILDGTMSSLEAGQETNAGLIFRLLEEMPDSARMILRYEAGIQWKDWSSTRDVIEGHGIHKQIVRAYGDLASRYRPGDRIWLFGYSRGAYAVRALAGVIDKIGLIKAGEATERHIQTAYRHYIGHPDSELVDEFRRAYCHPKAEIEMVGIFDTVKALGLRLPLIWRLSRVEVEYHDYHVGECVKRGRQALALNERRAAFEPVLWSTREGDDADRISQMWFRGVHGDIGGHVGPLAESRPLSNIPLVWMLEEIEKAGLRLPDNWKARFPTNVDAPSVGSFSGLGWLFLYRRNRKVGRDPSEHIHASAILGKDDWL
jgi:uncharacterized protein (DUF2235 family)